MRLLVLNMATDADDPILGFTTLWVAALARRCESVDVISMRAGRHRLPANVEVHSMGKERGYGEPRRAWGFYRELLRIVGRRRIDACFCHMMALFAVMAAPVLRPRRIPIVTWYAHPALTLALRLAHRVSYRMVASLETAYPYRHDRFTAVGQGIDTDLFAPDGSPPESPPILLNAGRLSPVKDHPTLLRATALLRDAGAGPFRVLLLGSPAVDEDRAYVRSLEEMVRSLSLGGIVEFRGAVPLPELPAWYRRATAHVNMTRTGSGDKVVLEAMACGRPGIAANQGFAPTLGDLRGDLLYREGDARDLADRLGRLLSQSPKERARMGEYLRGQVIRLHGLERLADRLMEILEEARRPR